MVPSRRRREGLGKEAPLSRLPPVTVEDERRPEVRRHAAFLIIAIGNKQPSSPFRIHDGLPVSQNPDLRFPKIRKLGHLLVHEV